MSLSFNVYWQYITFSNIQGWQFFSVSIHNTEHSFPSILICTIRLIKANVCLVGRMSEFPPEYVQVLSQQIPSTHCVPVLEMGSTKAVLALLRSMKEVPMTVRQ